MEGSEAFSCGSCSKFICCILLLFLLVLEPFSLLCDTNFFGARSSSDSGWAYCKENSCFWVYCSSRRVAFSLSWRSYTFLLRHILYFLYFSIVFFCWSTISMISFYLSAIYFSTILSIFLYYAYGAEFRLPILAYSSSTLHFETR